MDEVDFPKLPHDNIQTPEAYLPGTPMWVWVTLGAVSLISLVGIYYLIRSLLHSPEKAPIVFSRTIFEEANAQLASIAEKGRSMPLALFATSTSLILRDCLSKALNDPALYETNEELALRSASLEKVPSSVRDLLQKLANAKYAPSYIDEKQARFFTKEASTALRNFKEAQSQEGEAL